MGNESRRVEFLFLVNHFNNTEEVERFIFELYNISKSDRYYVMICDNSSNAAEMCGQAWHINVQMVHPPKNMGYLGGCSFALEHFKVQRGYIPEYVIISNTDIDIPDDYFTLLRFYSNYGSVIAPNIILADSQRPQNPYYISRPSYMKMLYFRTFYSSPALYRLHLAMQVLRRSKTSKVGSRDKEKIYAAHGAHIIIHETYFHIGCDISPLSFMYMEEFSIAERARKFDLNTIFALRIQIIHREHSTTSTVASESRRRWHYESAKAHLALWGGDSQ